MFATMPWFSVGCAGWSIPRQYAEHFPERGTHLERYAQRLPAVEINSSFYRPHRPETYARWAASVPEAFQFAVKMPKAITHLRRLRDATEPLERFLSEIAALGAKCGPLLVQLPPSLHFDATVVTAFFSTLRARFSGSVVCEPRHTSWFTDDAEQVLMSAQVARVAADPALVPEAAQPGGWPGLVYYRLHGSPEQVCLRCGGTIAMVRQGPMQRMTFFCPVCQPLDPAHPPPRQEVGIQTPYTGTVRTLAEARDFVLTIGIAEVTHNPKGKLPTLWDAMAFTGGGPDAWGEKLAHVWALREQLTATYPEQIFSGKIRGGRIVLMSIERLRQEYARYHRSLEACSELAQQLYDIVAQGPIATLPLRQAAGLVTRKDRGRFERALQELQATFNIARSPAADSSDLWVPFQQQYPQFQA